MTNHHSDNADELIARAAKDYNEPAAVPRDEMWERIVEARRAPRVQPIASARRSRYWVWPSAGVAAAGLIAVGVVIGRRVERSQGSAQRPLGSQPSLTTASRDSNLATSPSRDSQDVATRRQPLDTGAPGARDAGTTLRSLAPGDQNGSAAVAYRLAVVNHVVGSEAMITAFRASAHRGDVDAQLAKWSRDLLGETRLLESSAPPDDPTMKRLLEDLELILVQIVQYTDRGTRSTEDLDLIERSIHRRAVLSNLRSISAGRLPSGT